MFRWKWRVIHNKNTPLIAYYIWKTQRHKKPEENHHNRDSQRDRADMKIIKNNNENATQLTTKYMAGRALHLLDE